MQRRTYIHQLIKYANKTCGCELCVRVYINMTRVYKYDSGQDRFLLNSTV